jgi:AcrR family transcriptional regulator
LTASAPTPAGVTTRDRRRLRTMRALSHAAVELFERKGFDATTVEEIAAVADYSASTFFRLFPRKEDAVFFDLDARLEMASGDVAEATDPGEWPTIRKALLRHANSWEEDDPQFAAARTRLFHSEPALISRYLEYCESWENDLADRMCARRGRSYQHETAAHIAAGAIVTAYRTAFRMQAKTGGSLVDHLERALSLIEQSGFIHSLLAGRNPVADRASSPPAGF